MTESIYYALSLFLILPTALLYCIPLRKFLKKSLPAVISVYFIIYAGAVFIVPPILRISSGHNFLVMFPILALLFVVSLILTTLDLLRSFVVFVWACGLISYASGFAQAYSLGTQTDSFDIKILIIRIIASLLILISIVLFTHRWDGRFLTDTNVPIGLWLIFMPVPIILMYQNIVLIAYRPEMISGTYEFQSYLLIMCGGFIVFLLLTNVFYSTATLHIQSAKLLEEKKFLEFQRNQYSNITKDVERTNKMLHDFKHTINTLQTLAAEEGSSKITSYLKDLKDFHTTVHLQNYCKHAPINSVLNHYSYRANTEKVPTKLQVDIPENLPLEDHEICSLIGNLMENAIDACILLPEEKRQFSLSIVMQNQCLLIVSSNTFNGEIKQSGGEFASTKHSGMGIGIRSIRETVEHYGGTMNVHHTDDEFFVDIMLILR